MVLSYNRYIHILFISIVLLLGSCNKKKIDIIESEAVCQCDPFLEMENYNIDFDYVYDTTINFYSQYNPNDASEIMYLRKDHNSTNIYRYNLLTKVNTFVREFPKLRSFHWGANDWVLLELGDGNLWKMQANGAGLIQISFDKQYFHPKWNHSANLIIAYIPFSDELPHCSILTGEGELVHTISDPNLFGYCIYGSWNNQNNLIIGSKGKSVKVIDPIKQEILTSRTFPEDLLEINWINQHEAIALSAFGLYKYNVNSNVITKLRCQCPKKSYQSLCASKDGTSLTMTRVVYNQIETSTFVDVEFELVELGLNNLVESEIVIE